MSLSAGLLGGSLISLALGHQVHVRLAGLLSGAQLMEGHHHQPHSAVAYRWVLCGCFLGGGVVWCGVWRVGGREKGVYGCCVRVQEGRAKNGEFLPSRRQGAGREVLLL